MNILDDVELDQAIKELDKLLSKVSNNDEPLSEEINILSDAIEKYESATDILNRDYKIFPAKDVEGYLIFNIKDNKYLFRVYETEDRKIFTDYELFAEDVKVQIIDKFVKLYKYRDGDAALDYNLKILGKL